MFTGIVEEVGIIKEFKRKGKTAVITISSKKVLENTKVGDSIAVDGVCLTVTSYNTNSFTAELSEETLSVTKFNVSKTGDRVNLERALRLSDRLSGHLVTGHIDCIGYVVKRIDREDFTELYINFPKFYKKYVVIKGSIAVDGVSLTVNDVTEEGIRLNIIPHTIEVTTLKYFTSGTKVNLEFDIIAKYIENLINKRETKEPLTFDYLARLGYKGGNIL